MKGGCVCGIDGGFTNHCIILQIVLTNVSSYTDHALIIFCHLPLMASSLYPPDDSSSIVSSSYSYLISVTSNYMNLSELPQQMMILPHHKSMKILHYQELINVTKHCNSPLKYYCSSHHPKNMKYRKPIHQSMLFIWKNILRI